jgi:hypothetical protein
VSGDKLANVVGFRPHRTVTDAVLHIWDALERGDFGENPQTDSRFFNINWLKENMPAALLTAAS